ncbi:uncharacterized protein LOC18026792 isoform X2 [Eutrema salsugineum]|uniref:uncharacterized protein LOC18026792 isoform X2 n=1 Tax=Eutrema salsugineum TaxID=72664 RepID=UPI000CED2FAA|nr:uncharacterized protein LOC18026792 isoform X2 [Eutrema salsugineum]
MGDNENWRCELDIAGLSLIDEDDSLLLSSFPDPTSFEFSDTEKEDRGLSLFGDTHNCDEEILVSTTLQGKEDEFLQSHESPEPLKMMKYNLRKSLAWDKAFFTNAGVLEPDELSNMIESNHMCKRKTLPIIQEDVNRSTESISTLQSDCTVETSQDFVSFEDVRASIQRSAISSNAATPDKSKDLGEREAAPSPTLSTLDDSGSQEKMKPNVIRKRPSIRAQGLGKVTKQPVAAKEHNTSISRSPIGLSKSVRASVDVNKTKQEKNPKSTGKEPLAPRVPISRRLRPIVSKPVVPFKSALRSSSVASKNELTSSCSSLESCVSVSSSASIKSSLDSVKQKKSQSLRIASHSLANRSTTSKAASRTIGQHRVPPLSASRTYKSKLSSNVSLLSSSVDWSSESPRASTPNKIAKGNKKTVPGESGPKIVDTTQTLKPELLNNSKDVSAVQDDLKPDQHGAKRGSLVNGGAVRSASMTKPTGLRVPSPKIGYFDGARSSVARTPTGSFTGPISGLPKHGARSPIELTSTSRTKSQPARSPLTQESTSSKAKASPVSRSSRLIVSASASSPKLTNKMYSKVSAEEQLNDNAEEDNLA